ncbi:outer membrane protein assembly factor BamE [Halomonas sp. TBZ9]|uniref:Outer membrane protein assembly factor BamE n=1 Tax=Vreelandella azerica TaxID=2732867 RepID=A0A7Y3TWR6_9GAMM|nr:outer membrane protein assembly factor BamE [Halomonas azerica]NOG31353.1 outer membrane protein assembly factor BamE [Halomonas azerica]
MSAGSTGQSAHNDDEPRFPDLDSTYLDTGDFIDPDAVLRISEGQHKDQVRRLLCHPHFSEGIFNVCEWDYAFNIYTGEGSAYITCQYKLRFDEGKWVTSSHWRDPQCPVLSAYAIIIGYKDVTQRGDTSCPSRYASSL